MWIKYFGYQQWENGENPTGFFRKEFEEELKREGRFECHPSMAYLVDIKDGELPFL